MATREAYQRPEVRPVSVVQCATRGRRRNLMTGGSAPDSTRVDGAASGCCVPSRSGLDEATPAPEAPTPSGPITRDGMVLLPGGTFLMGTNDPAGYPSDGEGPIRQIQLNPFWID